MASRLKDVVNDALELVSGERDEFLVRVCVGDAALLTEARAMLCAYAEIGDFLEPPDVSRDLWARALKQAKPTLGELPPLVGAVLDDRYQLEQKMGAGASGSVYDSTDLLTGERVAVKVLTALAGTDLQWFRRELTALRLLELPGVVRLLDDGVHIGLPFLVMPRIDGTRFPGRLTPVLWSDMAETAIALMETLARIHARGVVHGDLKPANVLVDDQFRPIVLDLGLSSGPSVPGAVEGFEGISGTPAYLSPEQLMGERATQRSDLYAVGVMLYEALTGKIPHPSHRLDELVEARLSRPAPSLRESGIDPTTCPVDTIDALLAVRPEDREASAAQVAAKLRGEVPPLELLRNHPVLQFDDTVEALTQAALSTSNVTFYGPERSGRRRCLRRAAGQLRRAGKVVHWIDSEDDSIPGLCDVVIVDGAHIPVLPGSDCVIRVVDEPRDDSIRIRPLEPSALEALFGGSNRIFHLREDAARELHRRTKGWRMRIVEELSAWLRAGLARVEERSIVTERASLDLLASGFRVCPIPEDGAPDEHDPMLGVLAAAGPALDARALATATQRSPSEVATALATLVREGKVDQGIDGLYQTTSDSIVFPQPADHAAVARGLAPGTPGRLQHLVAADAAEDISAEACRSALAQMKEARVGSAHATATQGLASVRGFGLGPEHELPLLSVLLHLAGLEGTERAFELALYEIGRASIESEESRQLERLARVALLALRRDGERALALADVLGPLDDMDLERLRQAARAMAARVGQRDRSAEILQDVADWAARNDDVKVRIKLLEWKGWAAYSQAHFKEAVELQQQAMDLAYDTRSRLSTMLSVAETSIDAGLYERARELAEETKAAAAAARHPFYEARAEAVLRFAAYRSGSAERVDMELIDAVQELHHANIEAQLWLNEGAVAWRLGDVQTARTLVRSAARIWRGLGLLRGDLVTRAFLAALGEDVALDTLAQRTYDCPLPGVALQTFGLIALADPGYGARFESDARRLVEQIAPEYRALRREVASTDECLEWIQQGRPKRED